MYQCFHCLNNSVIWSGDFTFEDMGYDGEGVVHICYCTHCGAEIEYRVPIDVEESEGYEVEEVGADDDEEE